jgi:guanosine-3',5'-bis(diphosphate) 3'-pyrophosphohydrolase
MTALVDHAIVFATKMHEGQFRKGWAGIPYITHPLDVMNRLKRHGVDDEVTLAAAVLHDVVEDCGVTVAALIGLFGVDVGATVAEVTDPPGISKNMAKRLQVAKAPTMSIRAKLIKLADKTSNVHDIVENPPGWSAESIRGYTRSAVEVVDALGLNETAYGDLLADFHAAAHRALENV